MKTLTLTLLCLTALAALAHAQLNQMTLVGQYEGEAVDNYFGSSMTMGDFDSDDRDEFIIGAPGWGNNASKNYYYDWDGAWPTLPLWTMQGDSDNSWFDAADQNIGDINEDGIEDFALVERILTPPPTDYRMFHIFFGSQPFDSIPDWSMQAENAVVFWGSALDGCGDVNGDGGNDFVMAAMEDTTDDIRIYHGGMALDTIADWIYYYEHQLLPSSLGDVNGDGYGDILAMGPNDDAPLLFFGGVDMDTIADLIFPGTTPSSAGMPAGTGDVNADGINDFLISQRLPDSTSSYGYVYFGGPNVDNQPEMVLQNRLGEPWGFSDDLTNGDFNGDGYSDFAVSTGDLVFGFVVYIYLGNPSFNPVPDAMVTDWSVYQAFGAGVASGDVDGDSCDELLVGAPEWWFGYAEGRAYLYTGPEEWIDFGVAVEPEDLRRVPGWFRLHQNYPNPFNPTTTITFGLPVASWVKLEVFDIAGRSVSGKGARSAPLQGLYEAGVHEVTFDGADLASGIYLYRLTAGAFHASDKMILIK